MLKKSQKHKLPVWCAKGQRCWICDQKKQQPFRKAIIENITPIKIQIKLQSGKIQDAKLQMLEPRSASNNIYQQDLMDIEILNNPQLLYHIKKNFLNKKIYIYVGPTLLITNPYKFYPQLYSIELKKFYIQKFIQGSKILTNKEFPPHIYGIVGQAIKTLYQSNKNQSILVSGESGAGKTQANKQCMRFLAQYFHDANSVEQSLEEKILSCDPILESFGNAKTIRNDNSSRFGKYIDIHINISDHKIVKANIINYLLQKSRVTSQLDQQRNFHIFYYFLFGINKQQKILYGIPEQFKIDDFQYVKKTKILPKDSKMFQQIKLALQVLTFQNLEDSVWRILASILHLGNLQFQQQNIKQQIKCQISNIETLRIICKLLKLQQQKFIQALTCYKIKVGSQSLTKSFTQKQIKGIRDSLSRSLYQKLFSWLVLALNKSLSKQIITQKIKKNIKSIGLLDIYGFQVLKVNSFEQLCINFTNQRLQQLYIQQVFKAEKNILENQGLAKYIQTIQFKDNQGLIDLLDSNTVSIFNLLDEWCSVASPDQKSFLTKIRFNHKKSQYFPSSNLNADLNMLIIKHTPRQIQYNVSGFRQKNKNLLRDDILNVLKESKLSIILQMFNDQGKENNLSSNSNKIKRFLGSKFRSQMNQLTKQLQYLSDLHFIRCIKSNNNKQQSQFDDKVTLQQIKYLGILDSIKMRKQSYSIRIQYDQFCRTYEWYRSESHLKLVDISQCKQQTLRIFKQYFSNLGQEDVLFGHTKIFLKNYSYFQIKNHYKKYYKNLKQKAHLLISILIKNKYIRRRETIKKYKNKIIIYMQTFVTLIKNMRRKKAAVVIQRAWKKKDYQFYVKKYKKQTITLQSYFRTAIQIRQRIKKVQSIKKIQHFFLNRLKKKKLIAYSEGLLIIQKVVFLQAWIRIRIRNGLKLGKYINTLACLILNKKSIQQYKMNTIIKQRQLKIKSIQFYFKGFLQSQKTRKYLKSIIFLQNQYRTKVLRSNFKRLRNAALVIQKFYRQYYFHKIQSHRIFKKFFQPYNNGLRLYNQKIKNILFGTRRNKQDDQLYVDDIIKSFLNKYNSKMTIFYYLLDIENFIQLKQIYPNNSWLKNYLKLYKQNFQKYTFIQDLKISETFTCCATSNKLYCWGGLSFNNERINQINTHNNNLITYNIKKEELQINYQNLKKQNNQKIYETTKKKFKFINNILYQRRKQTLLPLLFKSPQKILQVSCGNGHIICRTNLKRIFTWGHGKNGQLGHGQFLSQQKPKSIQYFQKNNLYIPLQVAASHSSSIVLMSNRKLFWFGKNGTIDNVSIPTQLILCQKNTCIGNHQLFTPIRVLSSWSRTQSTIGLTILSYNNVLDSNVTLRNKIVNIIISKWQQVGIDQINPPFIKNIANYMSQCNVKMPINKPIIQMQSKRALKQLQKQIKMLSNQDPLDISFSQNLMGQHSVFK